MLRLFRLCVPCWDPLCSRMSPPDRWQWCVLSAGIWARSRGFHPWGVPQWLVFVGENPINLWWFMEIYGDLWRFMEIYGDLWRFTFRGTPIKIWTPKNRNIALWYPNLISNGKTMGWSMIWHWYDFTTVFSGSTRKNNRCFEATQNNWSLCRFQVPGQLNFLEGQASAFFTTPIPHS